VDSLPTIVLGKIFCPIYNIWKRESTKEDTKMTYKICKEDLISCHIAEPGGWSGLEMFGGQWERLYKTSYRRKNYGEKTFWKTSNKMEGRNRKRFKNADLQCK